MKNRKSIKIIFIFVIAVIAVIYLYWGNTKIGVTNITVTSDNIPDEFNGFKIVHIYQTCIMRSLETARKT